MGLSFIFKPILDYLLFHENSSFNKNRDPGIIISILFGLTLASLLLLFQISYFLSFISFLVSCGMELENIYSWWRTDLALAQLESHGGFVYYIIILAFLDFILSSKRIWKRLELSW